MFERVALILLLALAGPVTAELVDPMAPPGMSKAGRGGAVSAKRREITYRLSATYISADRRVAVINGRRVEEGGRIAGARVLEVLPTQVRLQRSSGELVVRLMPVTVKKPTADKQEQQ